MPFRVESSDVLVEDFDELVSDVNAASVSFVDFSDIVMSAGIVLGDFVSDLVSVEDWDAGRLEGWKVGSAEDLDVGRGEDGRLEGWKIGRLEDLDVGRLEGWGESIRDIGLELDDLNAALSEVEDGFRNRFRNIGDVSELEGATERLLSALEAVRDASREDISVQIAVEDAALMRLDNQERAESEHVLKFQELALELRQLEVESEREKTRVTREEVEKRTELNERASELRIEYSEREAEAHLEIYREVFDEIAMSFHEMEEFQESLRAPWLLAMLTEAVRESDVISRLEGGQSARDERTADRFAAGSARFRSAEVSEDRRALSYFDSLPPDVQRAIDLYREERAVELGTELPEQLSQVRTASDSFSVGVGDLVAAVPFDVVDAVMEIVEVRRDANAELVVLEQEAAAEIQIIQESVTLSAENKAKAIERIERETALRRIRIENEVSQRQRAAFQSVVTNFLSGVAQMIAAEAQLALARRATNALSGLFGGGSAVAAAGSGLFSSVLLPLLGGLTLAYGATKLIAPSTPSADVYERSQYGVSGAGTDRNVVETPGLTRASQESDTPVLEANINVSVEASGTRLGQANARERLKTERWGG